MKIYSQFSRALLAIVACISFAADSRAQSNAAPKKVLVVTAVVDFGHSSRGPGTNWLKNVVQKAGQFTFDFAETKEELAAKASAEGLKNYDGVFFLCSQGNIPLPDQAAFLEWIKSGKAFIGAHSATDTLRGTPYS